MYQEYHVIMKKFTICFIYGNILGHFSIFVDKWDYAYLKI